jgi:hypothetical protein
MLQRITDEAPEDDPLWKRAESAPLSWHPTKGGQRAWICFEDDKTFDLGPDGPLFNRIADKMLSGDYYPPDAVRFEGRFRAAGRPLQIGDRVLQKAPVFCVPFGPTFKSAVEIVAADRSDDHCRVGYVTASFHHGRGMWNAELSRSHGRLMLRVWSTACPNSWLFWLGLPLARGMQLRARRRAIEEFQALASA